MCKVIGMNGKGVSWAIIKRGFAVDFELHIKQSCWFNLPKNKKSKAKTILINMQLCIKKVH